MEKPKEPLFAASVWDSPGSRHMVSLLGDSKFLFAQAANEVIAEWGLQEENTS